MLINEESVARSYDMLRAVAPFNRWKLPPSSELKFRVVKSKKFAGEFRAMTDKRQRHTICISSIHCHHLDTLVLIMAHEMCHLRQCINGWPLNHGKRFDKMKKLVCKCHGFDPAVF
jgi:hypothetical protein